MALTGKSLDKPFESDLSCPNCDQEIHYKDANAELTNDNLICPHCGAALRMECADLPYNEEGDEALVFWLERR